MLRKKGKEKKCVKHLCFKRPCVERPCVERPCVERPCVERPFFERPCFKRPCVKRPCVTRPCFKHPSVLLSLIFYETESRIFVIVGTSTLPFISKKSYSNSFQSVYSYVQKCVRGSVCRTPVRQRSSVLLLLIFYEIKSRFYFCLWYQHTSIHK